MLVAAEQGILGVVAVVGLWTVCFRRGLRTVSVAGDAASRELHPSVADEDKPDDGERNSREAVLVRAGFLGAAAVLLIHGLLDVGLRHPPNQGLFWLLLGIMAGGGGSREFLSPACPSSPARVGGWSFCQATTAVACLVLAIWIAVTAVYRPLRADLWERRARIAEGQAAWAETVFAARQSLQYDPFRLRLHYLLGSALARWNIPGAPVEAVRVLQHLQELAPDYANIATNLGALLLDQGRSAEAIPLLQRAVEMNPHDQQARRLLAAAERRFDNEDTDR